MEVISVLRSHTLDKQNNKQKLPHAKMFLYTQGRYVTYLLFHLETDSYDKTVQ